MSDDQLFVGVAWCGEPWLAVAFDGAAFDHAAVFDGIGDAWLRYEERVRRLLVDVPVGLVETGETERRCDALAREFLGERRTAVFDPPVREATRKRRFPAASRVHERKTGRDLSRPAFEAREAIAAVDELLKELPETRDAVGEAHPELCFRAFAGRPLDYPPDVAAGYAERLRVLAEYDPDAPVTVQSVAEATDGAAIRVADVLDAVALAYTARPGPGALRHLPPELAADDRDDRGLSMRLWYRAETALDGS
jgi:predicted RNase H-like nuclease